MGCRISFPWDWSTWGLASLTTEEEQKVGEVKQYSWDKLRVEIDLSQYVIEREEGGEVIRRPGSVSGQQFQIKNCTNCRIYLFDWSNTVTIDDCTNVKVFLGAVKTSVFMRDCNNCVLVAASGQLRYEENFSFLVVNSNSCNSCSSYLSQPVSQSLTNSLKTFLSTFGQKYFHPKIYMQITRLCEGGHVPLRQQSAHHREQHRGQRGLLPVQLHRPGGPAQVGRADPLEQLLVPGLRLLPGPGPVQLEEGGEDVQGWRLSPAAGRQ